MHVTFLITTQPFAQPATFEKRSRKFLIFIGYNFEINFQTGAYERLETAVFSTF
jgi:hypothetical protein